LARDHNWLGGFPAALQSGGVSADCLPNVFIIGAPKCGTTSLHFYLDQHPEISMSQVKEPNVFSSPRWMMRLERDHYRRYMDCRAPRRGEASTSYSRYPVDGDAAARIHKAVPDARLIYLIRDPVERIISEYVHAVALGTEWRPIEHALRDFADPWNRYVCGSRYGTQLEHYLEHFDRSSMLVLEQSELRSRREAVMREIFDFLDVDRGFVSPRWDTELMTRADQVRFQGLGWRIRASVIGQAFRKLPMEVRIPIGRTVRNMLPPPTSRPTLAPELRSALVEHLRPEMEKVSAMLGRPLEDWADRGPAGAAAV
jgi:hypothetical protein